MVENLYHGFNWLSCSCIGDCAPETITALHRVAQQCILVLVPESGQQQRIRNHGYVAHLYGHLTATLVIGHIILPTANQRAPVGPFDNRTSSVIAIEIGSILRLAQRGIVLTRISEPVSVSMWALCGRPSVPRVVHNFSAAMEVDRHHEMYRRDPVDDGLRLGLYVSFALQPRQVWIIAIQLHIVVIVVDRMDTIFQNQVVGEIIGPVGVLKRADV